MAYREFERASPGQNEFVVISDKTSLKFSKLAKVRILSTKILFEKDFIKGLSAYEAIVVHYLNNDSAKLIAKVPTNMKILWIGWGGDYYSLMQNSNEKIFLLDKTRAAYSKNRSFKACVRHLLVLCRDMFRNSRKTLLDAIRRIDFFAPVLPEEYAMVKDALWGFKAKYLSWNYGCLDDFILPEKILSGNNILLGNSATYANNHLDAFELIKGFKLPGKIITPLNYGDKAYAESVIKRGKSLFNANFEPIQTFLPLADYVEHASRCSYVVMNHLRQQGLGNIIMMMHMGAKIFLNVQNPILRFFQSQGAFLFTTEHLKDVGDFESIKLTPEQIQQSRNVLAKIWAPEQIHRRTLEVVSAITYKQSKSLMV
ncbi:MAG: TDP-N-acetylfucosamine:lipid II N-acetylfucosaminyltransferase [Candidatus Riflebacteria bacterium]|nr:TDP-N-acetylfucosamine:lipid II N-acetylfucosaminyltransferase [Candidatus Riflebacteria bacterium]